MTRRLVLAATLSGLVAVVVVGGVTASNMGFKIVYQLKRGGSPESKSGSQLVGLPYIPKVGINTARDLFVDIGTSNIQRISKWLPASDSWQVYAWGSPDFALQPGEGYLVKVGNDVGYRILGSHDPSVTVELLSGSNPNSNSGSNLIALPYHATAATAQELFLEIGAANVQRISRYIPAEDSWQIYSFGQPDFPLVPGEAYLVKVSNDTSYSPSHY